jgi:Spy/CpxP family protein refolding chaperone
VRDAAIASQWRGNAWLRRPINRRHSPPALLLYKTLHGREAPAIELSHIWSRAGKAQQTLKETVMSDQSHPETGEPPGPRRRRRWFVVVTLLLAGALTGAAATRAVSQHYWRGESFMPATFDPARAPDRADRAVRHLAIEIDASNEQQEKLRGIVRDLVQDLLPMREKALATRQRGRMLLTQPNIDRAAIETLRAEQLALADGASRRLAQALGDAAEVLTPEQRRKLDDRLSELRERRGFWQGWHRG